MNSSSQHFSVREREEETRLDKLLSGKFPHRSRSSWQRLIQGGHVTVQNARVKPSYRVTQGEKIEIEIPGDFGTRELIPQEIPLEIVHEDPFILGVNKPNSLVVHPGPGHDDGTLANGLIARYEDLPDLPDPSRPGIVHRLDKETSGVLVVARTQGAFYELKEQFKSREVEKEYLALVNGGFNEERGMIDAPVGRRREDKTKMGVRLGGKEAQTEFSVITQLENATLLRVKPLTGRTHQIRVHMSYIDHKILGDTRYGGPPYSRLMLHAERLKLTHPEDGEKTVLEAPQPSEFRELPRD